jgi:hypothetical protein
MPPGTFSYGHANPNMPTTPPVYQQPFFQRNEFFFQNK